MALAHPNHQTVLHEHGVERSKAVALHLVVIGAEHLGAPPGKLSHRPYEEKVLLQRSLHHIACHIVEGAAQAWHLTAIEAAGVEAQRQPAKVEAEVGLQHGAHIGVLIPLHLAGRQAPGLQQRQGISPVAVYQRMAAPLEQRLVLPVKVNILL